MQFGTVLSDSSGSEEETESSDSSHFYSGFNRNDGISGSDVPSDEEEDDESDEDQVVVMTCHVMLILT